MFKKADFNVFSVEGLDERMEEIREKIQPTFKELDEYFVKKIEPLIGELLPIHIAQHIRRTTNAPDFTWSAMGGDNRGYKKYPHFTLGINGEYLVMWLSFIDNPQFEKEMAQCFLDAPTLFAELSDDFMINTDHTINTYENLTKENVAQALTRWRDIKKGEFQVGRVIAATNPILKTPTKARIYMLETYLQVLPLYKLAIETREKLI